MTDEQIVAIIEDLQNTSYTIEQACEHLGFDAHALTPKNLERIDEEIFLCDRCGCWCDRGTESDYSGNGEEFCSECETWDDF